MGSLCWGAPQHRLMTRSSNEFPDMRIQYLCIQIFNHNVNHLSALDP